MSGYQDWVRALPILEEHGESGMCLCFGYGGVGTWTRESGVML